MIEEKQKPLIIVLASDGDTRDALLYAAYEQLFPHQSLSVVNDVIVNAPKSSIGTFKVDPTKPDADYPTGIDVCVKTGSEVIVVGEIRDMMTANAIQRALTAGRHVIAGMRTEDEAMARRILKDFGLLEITFFHAPIPQT